MSSRWILKIAALGLGVTALACVDTSEPGADDGSVGDGGGSDSSGEDGGQDGGGEAGDQAPEGLSCGTLVSRDEPIVLGYVPTWTGFDRLVASLDYERFTHLAIAFANPLGPDGQVVFELPDEQIRVLVDKAHERGVKVLVSIAGASHSEEVRAAIEPDKRAGFIEDILDIVERLSLDGVDVDIEGGSVDATYEPFVVELAEKIRPQGKLVTSAVGAWFAARITDRALWCFDFLNIMSYDYAGSWGEAGDHSTYAHAEKDLSYWTHSRGYAKSRAVLGVPFYGYCWGEDCGRAYTPYAAIAEAYPDKSDQDWIVEAGKQISLNGPSTLTRKAKLAASYGGVMIWETSQDTPDARLFNALLEGLSAGQE